MFRQQKSEEICDTCIDKLCTQCYKNFSKQTVNKSTIQDIARKACKYKRSMESLYYDRTLRSNHKVVDSDNRYDFLFSKQDLNSVNNLDHIILDNETFIASNTDSRYIHLKNEHCIVGVFKYDPSSNAQKTLIRMHKACTFEDDRSRDKIVIVFFSDKVVERYANYILSIISSGAVTSKSIDNIMHIIAQYVIVNKKGQPLDRVKELFAVLNSLSAASNVDVDMFNKNLKEIVKARRSGIVSKLLGPKERSTEHINNTLKTMISIKSLHNFADKDINNIADIINLEVVENFQRSFINN